MVSLERKSTYRQKLDHKPIVNAFVEFIEGRKISTARFSQLDEVLFKLMVAFRANDKASFENQYSDLSRREPSPSAPYAYNDFLIFVLICGAEKFGLTQSWISQVLEVRSCSDGECKLTSLTFNNLISKNYSSTNNHLPTVITFQNVLEYPLIEDALINETYSNISQNTFPRFNSDFLNLVILRAFDVIVLGKEILGRGEVSQLKFFEKIFNLKVSSIGRLLHWIIVSVIYFLIIYTYFVNQSFQNLVKPHLGFFNALGGGGVVVMLLFSKRITKFNERIIKIFWGYKNNNDVP